MEQPHFFLPYYLVVRINIQKDILEDIIMTQIIAKMFIMMTLVFEAGIMLGLTTTTAFVMSIVAAGVSGLIGYLFKKGAEKKKVTKKSVNKQIAA